MTDHAHQNWLYQYLEQVGVYLHAKIDFIPLFFNDILQRYCNMCGYG